MHSGSRNFEESVQMTSQIPGPESPLKLQLLRQSRTR